MLPGGLLPRIGHGRADTINQVLADQLRGVLGQCDGFLIRKFGCNAAIQCTLCAQMMRERTRVNVRDANHLILI